MRPVFRSESSHPFPFEVRTLPTSAAATSSHRMVTLNLIFLLWEDVYFEVGAAPVNVAFRKPQAAI